MKKDNNDNIRQLLEMLDHPEDYSEQEISDLIHRDEETLATYHMMVETRRGSRHQYAGATDNVDEAWQRFEQKHLTTPHRQRSKMRIAASFIGFLLLSGIAFAAIHVAWQNLRPTPPVTETVTDDKTNTQGTVLSDSLVTDTVAVDTLSQQSVVYDNIPLETLLKEIASFYGAEVSFRNDAARQLRFHFVWNRHQGMEQVVEDLNQFERLNIIWKNNQLTVE